MIEKETLPLDVSRIVVSLCNDYDRRKRELFRARLPAPILHQYAFLNATIDKALSEVCEEGIRDDMRRDIGLGRGHRMSPIYCLSPKTFKRRKRDTKRRIAELLFLV